MIGPKVSHAFSASLDNEGSGAPNGAKGRELHPLPGTAPAFMTKAGHLSVLHSGLTRLSSRPGPGQRFLESPDANDNGLSAHHLSSASAASTWQSEHMPDGHDAQAAREQK